MAFGECAATICIARENGSLMLQTGQRVESNNLGDRFGVYGLTPEEIKIVEGAAK